MAQSPSYFPMNRLLPFSKSAGKGGLFPKPCKFRALLFSASLWAALSCSCSYKEPVEFLFPEGEGKLYGLSKNAVSGTLSFAKPGTLEYVLEGAPVLSPDYSLELEYGIRFSAPQGEDQILPGELYSFYWVTLSLGEDAWVLPLDASFLGYEGYAAGFRYAVPVVSPEKFSVTLAAAPGDSGASSVRETNSPALSKTERSKLKSLIFELKSLRFVPRWYGFSRIAPGGASPGSLPGAVQGFSATPFVYNKNPSPAEPGEFVIDPPPAYRIKGKAEISLEAAGAGVLLDSGPLRFDYTPPSGGGRFSVPPGILPQEPYPLIARAGVPNSGPPEAAPFGPFLSLKLAASPERPHPEAIPADPGLILAYPREAWRDRRYELFRWESFPQVLIFDTADYAVQDRFFKRLAFFTEKNGFRGRLVPDREIAVLHGWNAHDYRGEDLAAFFESARTSGFPLGPEETELLDILLAEGILRRDGNSAILPGGGALISISQESPAYLRSLFMVHEGFHGIFFIDPEFRDWSRRRWEGFPPAARRFILAYFDYQTYDIQDDYLVVNEFMAYCLQQSVSQAGKYFGETLAGRIASSRRRAALPPGDEKTGSWPEIAAAFHAEAAAFSAYVENRWGLAAGRVRRAALKNQP